jgi:mannose-6-phosphate isomerase-like protein (cupin superfamily)
MPFVPAEEARNRPLVGLGDAAAAAAAAPDGRVALIGTPTARCVVLHWKAGFSTRTHRHPHAIEMFLLISGHLRAWLEGPDGMSELLAEPGSLLYAEPGRGHRFAVIGDEPVTLLAIVAPNEDRADETTD